MQGNSNYCAADAHYAIPAAMKYCYWFSEIRQKDIKVAGGKGANLGELVHIGMPVPPGFVVSADAYAQFLKDNDLKRQIKAILTDNDLTNTASLHQASAAIKKLIKQSPMPADVSDQIRKHYQQLGREVAVAVRSSATAEDLPKASFAGQQDTFLNIKGGHDVVTAVRNCWASLFEARAIFYRHQQGFDHFKVTIAVPVQQMIQSTASGVLFTVNPTNNDREQLVIEAGFGIGQAVVGGEIIPDQYFVAKSKLAIILKKINEQRWQITRKGKVPVANAKRNQQKITDEQIVQLARYGEQIEQHYKMSQDIEWAVDHDRVYIVQTRAITTLHRKGVGIQQVKTAQKPLLSGVSASPGVGIGKARIIKNARQIGLINEGDILISPMTSPDFVPAMKRAAGIVTDAGGKTSHAAIVSRELGIPCVVGTTHATRHIKNGELITVDGTNGNIYKGKQELTAQTLAVPRHYPTRTLVYVNLAEPSGIERAALSQPDGIGLLRAEFMISAIGKHPKQFIKEKKQQHFVHELAERLEAFCKVFTDKPVVYRTTDFKTNEYAELKGGKRFEPHEENPLLGFRGAARYIVDTAVFALELEAIKKLRNKLGYKNLWVMLPFVRSVEELRAIKQLIHRAGLKRSATFKLWMMLETPANVLLLEQFIKEGIDGISIGSNDLTMLTLGVDRDNERVAHLYNEANPAVMSLIKQSIATCNKHKITSSICGQLPSDNMNVVKELVNAGITSLSVSVDAFAQVQKVVYETEQTPKRRRKQL